MGGRGGGSGMKKKAGGGGSFSKADTNNIDSITKSFIDGRLTPEAIQNLNELNDIQAYGSVSGGEVFTSFRNRLREETNYKEINTALMKYNSAKNNNASEKVLEERRKAAIQAVNSNITGTSKNMHFREWASEQDPKTWLKASNDYYQKGKSINTFLNQKMNDYNSWLKKKGYL